MALRSHLRVLIKSRSGDAIQNALVYVYVQGTTTAVTDMWTAQTGGANVVSLVTNNAGQIEAWLDRAKFVSIKITDNANTAYLAGGTGEPLDWPDITQVIDVDPAPADIAVLDYDQVFTGHNTFNGTVTINDVVTGLELGDNVPLQTHKPGVGLVKTLLTDSTYVNFGDQTGRSLGINFFTNGVSRVTIDSAGVFTSGTTHLGNTTITGSGTNTALTITPSTSPTGSSSAFTGSVAGGGVTIGFITTPQTGTYAGWKKSQNTLTNPSSGTIPDAVGVWTVGGPIASTNVVTTRNYAQYIGGTLPASGSGSFGLAISNNFTTAGLWLSANANSTTAAAGILFGLAQDIAIYRSAANAITVSGGLTAGTTNLGTTTIAGTGSSTALTITPPLTPTGSASAFTGSVAGGGVTLAFQTTPQTGTYAGWKKSQNTLTNPSSGTIPDAIGVWALGGPIASTNVVTTRNYGQYLGSTLPASGSGTFGLAISNDFATNALWLSANADSTTAAGGIAFGLSRDSTLFRSAASQITIHAGTVVDVGNFQVDSAGRVGLGIAPFSSIMLRVLGASAHPGSASTMYGAAIQPSFPATTTLTGYGVYSSVTTAATSFTMATGAAFTAANPGIGAGSTVTNMYGAWMTNQGASGVTNAYGLNVAAQTGAATLNVGARIDASTTAALWLGADTTSTTVAGGIAFGSGRDVTLYRSGSAALQTNSALTVDGALTASTSLVVSAGNFRIDSSGRMVSGGGAIDATTFLWPGRGTHPSSATTLFGIVSAFTAPSTATVNVYENNAQVITAAASFTLSSGHAYFASSPSIGASSAITTAYGFRANTQGISGVTNAYGFYGNATSGAGTLNVTARFDTGTTCALWLGGDTTSTTIAGGIAFGSGRDVSIFRSGTNALTLTATAGVTLRIAKRVTTIADTATLTPDADGTDGSKILTLSQDSTIANPTGTPTPFQQLTLRIKSTSARALTWGSQYRGGTDVSLPTTTTGSSKTDYFSFQWNAEDTKWDILAVARGY